MIPTTRRQTRSLEVAGEDADQDLVSGYQACRFLFKLICDRYYCNSGRTAAGTSPQSTGGRPRPRKVVKPGPASSALGGASLAGHYLLSCLHLFAPAKRFQLRRMVAIYTATIMDLRFFYPSRPVTSAHAPFPPLYTCLLMSTPPSLLLERVHP